MPLHADHELALRVFDCLNHAIRRVRHRTEIRRDIADCLMMEAIDARAASDDARKVRLRCDLNRMRYIVALFLREILMANCLWQLISNVLQQCATTCHIQRLSAATHAKNWQMIVERPVQQPQLCFIAQRVNAACLGMRRAAIGL